MAQYKYNHPARRFPRSDVSQPVCMADEDGTILGVGMMLDVSAGGAKIQVKDEIDLPGRFVLILSKDGRVHRRCKLTWRAGPTVGVQFVSATEDKPGNKKPPG